MIIATAGHVDHGKTLLVKALTGVDADRLPEEKKRGMTIDLGFAYLPVDAGETLGFVDVPGHERFIHNMLAGVAGIDFVMFVIAADDGPMPQTREHLAILDLLGVKRGAIALTKIDRVSPSRRDEVRDRIAALLAVTTLANAPIFPVSAVTGEGIDALKVRLIEEARAYHPNEPSGNFRLAVDRCFSISGVGCIVTGTVFSGKLSAGDSVRILNANLSLRARMIHAQNAASPTGVAGQRCAINLAGPELKQERIERGDWVVTGDVPGPVRKLDARLRVLRSELRPLAHWTPVHVHTGAAEVPGRVVTLEGSSIEPGEEGLVQFVLDRAVGAVYGDGLIVRDQSAQRTLGGGRVIDIFPPLRGRARPARLAYIKAMDDDDTSCALGSLLNATPGGLNLKRLAQNRNLTAEEATQVLAANPIRMVDTVSGPLGFSHDRWKAMRTGLLESLASLHRRSPNLIPNEGRLFLEAGIRVAKEVQSAIVTELVKEQVVVREPFGVRLRMHAAKLNPADAAWWTKVEPLLQKNPLRPPPVGEIAAALGVDLKRTESFLVRASRIGLLVRVSENRFFSAEGLREHARFTEEIAAANGGAVTAAQLRDRAGIGRVLAIEVLEYFDRIHFTRRVGDGHFVQRPAQEMWGSQTRPV